ncbi:MAG: amidohydrolase family protein [Xanthobacteraceae bacterium]
MLTRRGILHGFGAAASFLLAPRADAAVEATSPARTAVNFELPPDTCDCHVHILDPARFPYIAKRVYTPPQASIEDLLDLQRALRMDRVVIVQPSVYGADNSCTLNAIRTLGARARGVAVVDKDTSQTEIDEWTAAGVRGIRLNLNTTPSGELDPDGSKRTLDMAAEKILGRGWHIQFYTRPHIIAALKGHIEQLPFPVVFDHFGGAKAADGPSQHGFAELLDLVKSGRAYVKISGAYRASDKAPDFADALPLARTLVAANPDRVLWGSDWPHPNSAPVQGRSLSEIAPPFPVDDGLLLNQVSKWVADPSVRQKLLVDNAARLYAFEDNDNILTGSVRPSTKVPNLLHSSPAPAFPAR